jgi:hypothetical protein
MSLLAPENTALRSENTARGSHRPVQAVGRTRARWPHAGRKSPLRELINHEESCLDPRSHLPGELIFRRELPTSHLS